MSLTDALTHAVAGTIGGILAYSALYPLEVIRTHLQVQVSKLSEADLQKEVDLKEKYNELKETLQSKELYTNAFDCARKLISKNGIKGLYNGLTSGILGVGLSNAIYFFWYNLIKSIYLKVILQKLRGVSSATIGPFANIIIASVAGIVNVFMTSPIWVVNTRLSLAQNSSSSDEKQKSCKNKNKDNKDNMDNNDDTTPTISTKSTQSSLSLEKIAQYQNNNYNNNHASIPPSNPQEVLQKDIQKELETMPGREFGEKIAKDVQKNGIYETFRKIINEEGIAGLYKGLLPSLILVSNPATQFMVYEQLLILIMRFNNKNSTTKTSTPTSMQVFFTSAFAKAVATVVTYPYQVVKSRQQVNTSKTDCPSMLSIMLSMYKNEGFSSFFKGMSVKLSQTVTNAAIMFLIYEKVLHLVKNLVFKMALRTV